MPYLSNGLPYAVNDLSESLGRTPSQEDDDGTDSDFSSSSSDLWDSQRILSLGGSGPQGLCSLYILEGLMDEVETIERQSDPPAMSSTSSPLFRPVRTGEGVTTLSAEARKGSPPGTQHYRPCHYFDCIGGVGAGGIFAIMLGVMRFTMQEAISRGEKMFDGLEYRRRKKNSRILQGNLERFLEKDFDEDVSPMDSRQNRSASRSLGNTLKGSKNGCQTIVFTTHKVAKGIKRPYVFRSYCETSPMCWNSQSDTYNISVVDACRASLADPLCFPSVAISGFGSFRDASQLGIDPALETYHETRNLHGSRTRSIQCLLSIETSSQLAWTGRFGKSSTDPSRSQISDVLDVKARKYHFRYERIRCSSSSLHMLGDSCHPSEVRSAANAYIESIRPQLREWAKYLVSYRRVRAQTVQWDRYVGLRIPCPVCAQSFERAELISHLDDRHPSKSRSTNKTEAFSGEI